MAASDTEVVYTLSWPHSKPLRVACDEMESQVGHERHFFWFIFLTISLFFVGLPLIEEFTDMKFTAHDTIICLVGFVSSLAILAGGKALNIPFLNWLTRRSARSASNQGVAAR
jgi:hypothetical protein